MNEFTQYYGDPEEEKAAKMEEAFASLLSSPAQAPTVNRTVAKMPEQEASEPDIEDPMPDRSPAWDPSGELSAKPVKSYKDFMLTPEKLQAIRDSQRRTDKVSAFTDIFNSRVSPKEYAQNQRDSAAAPLLDEKEALRRYLQEPMLKAEQERRDPNSQRSKFAKAIARGSLGQLKQMAQRNGDADLLGHYSEVERGLDGMNEFDLQDMLKRDKIMDDLFRSDQAGQRLKQQWDLAQQKRADRRVNEQEGGGGSGGGWKKELGVTNSLNTVKNQFDQKSKKYVERSEVVKELETLLSDPNANIGYTFIKTALARAAGDKGALSNYDVTRYGTQQGFINKMNQLVERVKDGGMTEDVRKELTHMTKVFSHNTKRNFKQFKDSMVKTYLPRYRRLGVNPNEINQMLGGEEYFEGVDQEEDPSNYSWQGQRVKGKTTTTYKDPAKEARYQDYLKSQGKK